MARTYWKEIAVWKGVGPPPRAFFLMHSWRHHLRHSRVWVSTHTCSEGEKHYGPEGRHLNVEHCFMAKRSSVLSLELLQSMGNIFFIFSLIFLFLFLLDLHNFHTVPSLYTHFNSFKQSRIRLLGYPAQPEVCILRVVPSVVGSSPMSIQLYETFAHDSTTTIRNSRKDDPTNNQSF